MKSRCLCLDYSERSYLSPPPEKVLFGPFEGVSEAGGDYTIIELSDVRIEKEESAVSEKDDPVKTLNSARANYEYQAVIKSLTEQADIMRIAVKDLQ